MTSKPVRYTPPSARQLLSRILETPELVSAVRALPAAALAKLIEHVGLEDAGDLVALATTEQLQLVFDEDLWKRERPGEDETFDADRFALWLEVMLETGEELTARKLTELPAELVTLALHRHILVINADELSVEMADPTRDFTLMNKALDSCLYQEISEYQVISRRHDGWDTILAVLLALDRDHHDFLRRLLARCCAMSSDYIEESGGLYRVLSSEEMLETDLAADREDRRATQGYVAPSAALSLLRLARGTALEVLRTQARDPVTRAYFRELVRRTGTGRSPQVARAPASHDQVARDQAARDQAAREQAARDQAAPLVEVLRQAEVLPETRSPLLLEGRSDAAPLPVGLLAHAIPRLQQEAPEAHAARMEELAYLANVLIAGCSVGGRGFRPLEAAQVAVATVNLGLEHLLEIASAERGSPEARDRRAVEVLASEGADKLFLLGVQLLQQLALEAPRTLERLLGAAAPGDQRRARALERGIASVRSAVGSGKPWLARGVTELLEGAVEESDLSALRGLLDECPTRRGALRDDAAGVALELITTLEQRDRARTLLDGIGALPARS
jgi:hypothetical protein